jgi:hypothetical protein
MGKKVVNFIIYNVLQIGGRFNAANVLLYAAFITNLKTII